MVHFLEASRMPRPEFCAFVLCHPKPRWFFPALKVDAENDTNGFVDYPLTVTDLHDNTVQGDDLMVEDTASRLSLPDRQGVKVAIAVTRDVNGDGAFFGLYRLAALAIMAV